MPVRIAYLILAHREPRQLARLIQRLRGPGVHIVLHIDKNSSGTEWDWFLNRLHGPDITRAASVECRWGDFSLIDATLNCLNALSNERVEFDFAILLSGQDYPIQPQPVISEFLSRRKGRCLMFIYPFPFPYWVHGGYHRLPTWRIALGSRPRRILPPQLFGFRHKKMPLGYHPFGGSQWWCLPREAVLYIQEFIAAHPPLVDYFRQAVIPDEMFFHTILGNSHFPIEPGPNNITYMKWSGGPSPAVLTSGDFADIKASEHLFARKFDIGVDASVLDRIDSDVLGVEPAGRRGRRVASA